MEDDESKIYSTIHYDKKKFLFNWKTLRIIRICFIKFFNNQIKFILNHLIDSNFEKIKNF